MKKIEKIIRYIIITFIILCALGAFSNNQIISGIMLIISGIVLLPYIDEKIQFKSKKIIEIIISVVLFFSAAAVSPTSNIESGNKIYDIPNSNSIVNTTLNTAGNLMVNNEQKKQNTNIIENVTNSTITDSSIKNSENKTETTEEINNAQNKESSNDETKEIPETQSETQKESKPVIAQESTKKENTTSQEYILNKSKKKFHRPGCSSVKQMAEKNKKVFSGSREDVINQGYTPCKKCNP